MKAYGALFASKTSFGGLVLIHVDQTGLAAPTFRWVKFAFGTLLAGGRSLETTPSCWARLAEGSCWLVTVRADRAGDERYTIFTVAGSLHICTDFGS